MNCLNMKGGELELSEDQTSNDVGLDAHVDIDLEQANEVRK